MKIQNLRDYFTLGLVSDLRAVSSPMSGPGHWLLVCRVNGAEHGLQTSLGHPRVFASLDTLAAEVTKLGAARFEVVIYS